MTRTKSTIIGLAVVFGTVLAGCSSDPVLPSVPLDPPAPVTVTQPPTVSSPSAAPSTVKTTTPKASAPAPVTVTAPAPVTVTEQQAPTVIVKQAPPAPVTITQDKPYADGRTIYTLPGGLLCADLNRMGFSSADAYWYWELHSNPPLMDADSNGIPCETVYPGGARPDHPDQ